MFRNSTPCSIELFIYNLDKRSIAYKFIVFSYNCNILGTLNLIYNLINLKKMMMNVKQNHEIALNPVSNP